MFKYALDVPRQYGAVVTTQLLCLILSYVEWGWSGVGGYVASSMVTGEFFAWLNRRRKRVDASLAEFEKCLREDELRSQANIVEDNKKWRQFGRGVKNELKR